MSKLFKLSTYMRKSGRVVTFKKDFKGFETESKAEEYRAEMTLRSNRSYCPTLHQVCRSDCICYVQSQQFKVGYRWIVVPPYCTNANHTLYRKIVQIKGEEGDNE